MPIIFLDTDIGGDCDDTGAMAVLHHYMRRGLVRAAGAAFCTSSPCGVGCISAINRYYGVTEMPIGTLKDDGFMTDRQYNTYGSLLCDEYKPDTTGDNADDAVRVYRRSLATADGPVTVVAIGPERNLYNYLCAPSDDISPLTGLELTRQKVGELVVMGGNFADANHPEFNIAMDVPSAQYVAEHWPTPVVYSGFEIGEVIMTGAKMMAACGNENPVRRAYEVYCNGNRNSWDQTAVVYAAEGVRNLWQLSEPGRVGFDEKGRTLWTPGSGGRHRYLLPFAPLQTVTDYIDELMIKQD